MKSISKLITGLACILVPAIILQSCAFLKEIGALGKCEFRMGTLERPMIAGIEVSKINRFSDLSLSETAAVGSSVLKGELPLTFTLNIEARNPNPATAALNRLEYIAFIDDVEMARGLFDRRVEIPPGDGITTIPLQLSTDLVRILDKESRAALFNFGLNLADASNRPTRVTLKIKPTIMIGMAEIVYPGYFNIKYDFTSGN